MGNPIVFVKIPTHLEGNVRQPSSVVSPGPRKRVGSIKVGYDQVDDVGLRMSLSAFHIPLGIPHNFPVPPHLQVSIGLHLDDLNKQKRKGYEISRQQWIEEIGTTTVSEGDSQDTTVEITLGTTDETDQSVSKTTGYEFGTSHTDADSESMNIGLEFDGITAGASTSVEHSTTTESKISKGLEVSKSSSKIQSESKTTSVTYTANGGDTGARYVIWQVVDEITITRIGDGKVISQSQVRSYTQRVKYPFK